MTWFLNQYVVDHRHMPRGKVWAEYRSRSLGFSFGTIDFDQLRALEEWPH
jgi:hypothetical protein